MEARVGKARLARKAAKRESEEYASRESRESENNDSLFAALRRPFLSTLPAMGAFARTPCETRAPMTFSVALLDEGNLGSLDPNLATRLVALTFSERGFEPDELDEVSIVLVGPEDMRSLNERFRGKDYPTDVLSFDMDGPEGEMVGEIVICPEAAEMPIEELVVHGSLHLAGMDHPDDDFDASEMAKIQTKVMERARDGRT